jgi:hypothetical protein
VELARINLGYANVTAPISGRAGQQQVTEGALVGQSEATLLTTVEQIDPIYVNFSQAATDLERLRRAQASGHVQLVDPNKHRWNLTFSDGTPLRARRHARLFRRGSRQRHRLRHPARHRAEPGSHLVAGHVRQCARDERCADRFSHSRRRRAERR